MVKFNLTLIVCLFGLTGCNKMNPIKDSIDNMSFRWTGGTLFTNPQQLTTKELHFDTGNLLGHSVIIEGDVVITGNYFTHVVLSDDSGRMLVVLTQMENAEELLKKKEPGRIKVLGTVERGKKGLPFILARSLRKGDAKPPKSTTSEK